MSFLESPGPLILDISSDEEAGSPDVGKGGGCEFIEREDVYWLSNLLAEVGGRKDDDSDDVVFVSEVLAKTPKKSESESLKPLPRVVDDDDDCMVLDGDPDKSIVAVNSKVEDDDDYELEIVGEKGEVACRDFPHPRHHCAKYPFASTPHDVHCGQCHCYVCDSLAPCSNWGTGANGIDHCHASDKEEYWKAERKHAKKGDKTHSKSGSRLELFFQSIQAPGPAPAQPKSLPENQAFNPVPIRPCALSSNVSLPNAIDHVRSQPSGYVAPGYNTRSHLVSVQSHPTSANIVAPKVAFRNKSYRVGSQNPPSLLPRVVFKRSGLIGASRNDRHAHRIQSPLNWCPLIGSNGQIVGSQAAVSGIPPLNHSPSVPQINSQTCSSYRNLGSIPGQSQMPSPPFVNGNSLTPPTLQPYMYSQPSVGNINSWTAPEPYIAYMPSNHVPSQSCLDARATDSGIFCDSSVSHSKMRVRAEQSQIRDTVSVTSPIDGAGCQIPDSRELGSLDFNLFESWTFENESFPEAVEASASADWNIYSPEPSFADTGTLFDV